MCFIVISATALKENQAAHSECQNKTTHCIAHLEQIEDQGTSKPLLNRKTVCDIFTTERCYLQKECAFQLCDIPPNKPHTLCMNELNPTTNKSFGVHHLQFDTLHTLITTKGRPARNSTLVSKRPTLCDSGLAMSVLVSLGDVPTGRQHKGGSKSSTSSSSSHRSGSGHRQGNVGSGSSDRARGNRQSFSSGSTDSSEDDKDDDDKRRRPYRRRNKEPKSKPGFSDDEDDEATDSADEGRGQDTPNSMTMDFSPQSQSHKSGANENRAFHTGSSKDRFRPSDLPNNLSGLKKSRGSEGSSSTISVESIVSSKETSTRVEAGSHVPQSPVNMAVGYGNPAAVGPPSVLDSVLESTSTQLTEKSPAGSTQDLTLGTPTMDSPRPLTLKEPNSPGTPPVMSPEIPPTFQTEEINNLETLYSTLKPHCFNTNNAKMSAVGSVTQPAASGLPAPSSFGTLPFETTWGWQPPVYSPFALPGSSHPGSVATTPAPTSDNSGGFLRPGTTALLQATVCQESEGVLIVTVRWRNRNFSGSLIDIGHHDWAPPKLSCPYGDIQIKDLYKQKDVESQSVNVEVLEDSKETNSIQSRNEPDIILTDSPKKDTPPIEKPLPTAQPGLAPPIPMETESITVMASSDPSEVDMVETNVANKQNLRNLLAKPEPYSDISDVSDTEDMRPTKRLPKDLKQTSEPRTTVSSRNGFYPYKSKGKESSLTTLSANLPSFGEVGLPPKSSRKEDKMVAQGEECIPDSQPSSPKERSSKQTSSVDEVRTKLLSTYPGSSTSAIPVSMPEQDQRHSKVGMASLYGSTASKVTSSSKSHPDSSQSALQTLSDVAASLIPVNDKDKPSQSKHQKMTNLTQEDFKQDPKQRRSLSPRPKSLVPKTNKRRSPSPSHFSKQTLEQQAATLPSFDPVPGPQRGSEVPSPPVVVKPATCVWGRESPREEDGHDSDSSGSGSLMSINRPKGNKTKKRSKTVPGEIKTDKSSREETGNAIQPQTPALPPIPSNKFDLKMIQPISPGPEGPHPSTGHPIHPHKVGTAVTNKRGGLPTDVHTNSHLHLEMKKPISTRDNPPSSTMQVPTVGDVLKKVSGSSVGAQHPSHVTVSSGHGIVSKPNKESSLPLSNSAFVRNEGIGDHDQEKEHHQQKHTRHQEERRNEQQHLTPFSSPSHHRRVHPHDVSAVIDVSEDRASPNSHISIKGEGKPTSEGSNLNGRGKKRKAPELSYEMVKRPEREEHPMMRAQGMKFSKQLMEMSEEGEEMIKGLPPEFKALPPGFKEIFDPNLPMSMQYQLIAFMNQKKMQDEHQQQMDNSLKVKREPPNRIYHHGLPQDSSKNSAHAHPRRQKSNDHNNPHNSMPVSHDTKLPRQSSSESNHRSSLTNIATQSAPGHVKSQQQQNGPTSVIHTIKSEPEEIRYVPVNRGLGGQNDSGKVICSTPTQAQQTGSGRRQQSSVRRPAPHRRADEPSWSGIRRTPPPSQSPHPHPAHGLTISNYTSHQWPTVMTPHADHEPSKPKHEVTSESSRNGDSGNKKNASNQPQEWVKTGSSFSPVLHPSHHGGRPPTSSPSHSHSSHTHHHQVHREHSSSASTTSSNRGERERERANPKHGGHNFSAHQEHERGRERDPESERERSTHMHSTSSQHPRQNSSSSTSSNHSTSHPSSSGGSSRNHNKEVNQAAANAVVAQQQQQILQMQHLAALHQLQQQQQLSPSALAALQRGHAAGGIQMEEYLKHLQQQQYEMLQKAATMSTPTTLNQQELLQLQMQMAAQMGVAIDPNAAMALMVQQQQVQAQQQAVQQQQQQAQEAQAQAQVQAAHAAAAQHALFQAAAQNSVIPFMYPIAATPGQIPQTLGFYDPNAITAGMPVPFAIPNAPKRE